MFDNNTVCFRELQFDSNNWAFCSVQPGFNFFIRTLILGTLLNADMHET